MTDLAAGDVAASTRRQRRVPKAVRIIVATVAGLVAAALVVGQLTPRPYVLVFRALIGLIDDSVKLGPYAEQVKGVDVSDVVTVPVEGAPDAELTIYSTDEGNGEPKPLILFIHGGGWVVGTPGQIGSFAKLLASEGYVVASLGYSLAPEHTYPTPVVQAAAALDHLQANAARYGADPTTIFIGGNSAGAQIASQMGSVVSDPDFAAEVGVTVDVPAASLKGLLLLNGVYDFSTVGRAGFGGFRSYAWSYTGEKDYASYSRIEELSTVRTATAAYPPSFMTAGDADPLESQTYQLDASLRAKGVDVTSRYWTGSGLGLGHDYMYDLRTKAAQTAYEDAVAFLQDHATPTLHDR
jgi:acetyl esterase/lipase